MPQKLLGLDMGSYSIKGALFETTFRSFELTDLFESPPLKADDLAPEERAVVTTEAILRLLEEHSLTPQTTVTAIPGTYVSTRLLTLPLPERQVEKVLPFELESDLPFELDDILVAHHTILSNKAQTTVLAAAVRKTLISEHLSILRNANLEPAFVGLDSIALYNLNQLTLSQEGGTYAIVDIGHQKTSVCIVANHRVQYVRTLMSAGKAVTESIRNELDLTWDQALEVKHTHGILELEGHPLQSKDLRRLSAAIRKSIDPLAREISQTFQAYRAMHANLGGPANPVEQIYFCGGTSLLRNLPEYFAAITNLKVSRLHFFPPEHEVSRRLAGKEAILAQAVGLGLRAAARGANAARVASLNFRTGDFAFARDMTDLKKKAMFFGQWIAAIFLVALVHIVMRYENFSRQLHKMDDAVMRTFNEIIPDAKQKPKTSALALKTLEERIRKYRDQQEVLTAGLNEMTALGVLLDISKRIPQNIPVDTQEISIDRNMVTVRANTDSFTSVDKIVAALHEQPQFRKIEKGDIRDSPDGKKSFQVSFTIGGEETTEKGGKK